MHYRTNPADPSALAKLNDLREGFVGWFGFGGSVFQWHPELGIAFAYVPTQLCWYDFAATRGGELQEVVTKCVRALGNAQ